MTSPLFAMQEIGSLAKPIWRVKAVSKTKTVSAGDIERAMTEGRELGVDGLDELKALLEQATLTGQDKQEIKRFSSIFGLRLLEHVGLDWVYDGEQLRTEMYDEAMRHVEHVEKRGWVRSFDNRYYTKQAIAGRPKSDRPYHLDEFRFLQGHAKRPLKVPITGAYTLLDWSYQESLGSGDQWFGPAGRARRRDARREVGLQLARDVLRPNIQALVEAGARRVQIDEPAATTVPLEVPLFVELFNESVRGIDADFSIHVCFSDYSLLFPHILELKGCNEFAPEFANDDSWQRGTKAEDRPGYRSLDLFAEHASPFRIGLGVTDIHTDRLESTELIEDRIAHAAKTLGDPAKVFVNPDCGLRTRSWEVSRMKLENMVEATRRQRLEWGQETVTPAP